MLIMDVASDQKCDLACFLRHELGVATDTEQGLLVPVRYLT